MRGDIRVHDGVDATKATKRRIIENQHEIYILQIHTPDRLSILMSALYTKPVDGFYYYKLHPIVPQTDI